MENLKDQQIESQKETIQSLERKVESLENELQKFLDPDSGTIRPEWKPKSKHGERALLEQVQTLQKELDCIETSKTIQFREGIKNTTQMRHLIRNLAAGAFLPYNGRDHAGKTIYHGKWATWSVFRSAVHQSPKCEIFWSDPGFRLVMDSINDICEQLLIASRMEDDPEYAMTYYHNAADCLTLDSTEDKSQGTLLLKAAIEQLYEIDGNDRQGLETEEIDYLFFSIQIIIQCQRLWLSMVQPEDQK